MKKVFALCAVLVLGVSSMSAQDTEKKCCGKCENHIGLFNHLGWDINVGTQGIGIDLAVPITKYLELSVGVNHMPAFTYSTDAKIGHIKGNATDPATGFVYPYDIDGREVHITGNTERTTGEAKLSIYPFGTKNSLFVVGGISFGGNRLMKFKGYSSAIDDYYNNPNFTDVNGNVIPASAKDVIQAEIDKYEFQFDKEGNTRVEAKARKWRPYVGLGYGRLIPKKNIGFRVEAGVQLMGKVKLYQGDREVSVKNAVPEGYDDDISKVVDEINKYRVYPVLKFAITGKFL